MADPGLGLIFETVESRNALHSAAIPFQLAKEFALPASVDHRGWRAKHVEDQKTLGSCVGHGSSSSAEVLHFIDTRGEEIHFNRMASYIWSQMENGLQGRDQGAMVSGSVQAAKSKGFALESQWPYTGRYTTNVPPECLQEGQNHLLIGQHVIPRSYDEIWNGLGSGVHTLIFGTKWYETFANNNGVITRVAGRVLGGHCYFSHGYSDRKDAQGRPFLIIENSHSKQWGNEGFAEMSPDVVLRLMADRDSELFLWTDIKDEQPAPRDFDFMKDWPNL